jgi:hypothetical protein
VAKLKEKPYEKYSPENGPGWLFSLLHFKGPNGQSLVWNRKWVVAI